MSDIYAPRSNDDVARLVLEHPLAWVVSGGDGLSATALPIRPVFGANGAVVELLGHYPRKHPQAAALRAQPGALFLFMGPHGYVSPSWFSDRNQAPTWNYVSVQIEADVRFIDDDLELRAVLEDLVQATEQGRPNPWSLDEVGTRYTQLAARIIPFRAAVRAVRGRFKLGQDERNDTFSEILTGLAREGRSELHDWMAEFSDHD
ncbi:MAG TPA: FMN-binding negative transcriptional regulator [Caulobacteraceae bacterium]|jgi:predicted FMN-binding regulatory protein PaiB|nr:FMN-binding negative transcriptional regulator [Caulobacteraceae bacterium]